MLTPKPTLRRSLPLLFYEILKFLTEKSKSKTFELDINKVKRFMLSNAVIRFMTNLSNSNFRPEIEISFLNGKKGRFDNFDFKIL